MSLGCGVFSRLIFSNMVGRPASYVTGREGRRTHSSVLRMRIANVILNSKLAAPVLKAGNGWFW